MKSPHDEAFEKLQRKLARIRAGVEQPNVTPANLARSQRAAATRRRVIERSEDEIRTVAHASLIIAHYREQGLRGKRLGARVVRHAKMLSGIEPALAVELLERAIAIEWEAKQAC